MTSILKAAVVGFTLTMVCLAQESLVTVSNHAKQKWPAPEVDKIYFSACEAVQREFDNKHTLRPRVMLVLGADKNSVDYDKGTVLLVRWDRDLFAQGVVRLAFEGLLPLQQRALIARRAVNWADSTVDVARLGK